MDLSKEPVKTDEYGIKLYSVLLTEDEHKMLQQFFWDKQMEEMRKSISHIVQKAKDMKKIAEELYPKHTFEVYVEKDTKDIFMIANGVDATTNAHICSCVIKKYQNQDIDKQDTRERIYIK